MTIGGRDQDTMLFRPRLISAAHGRVAVFDYGDRSVTVFDDQGRLTWKSGRRGSGPGEFQGAFDLEIAPDGSVWVLDPDANRLTVLDRTGKLDTVIQPGAELIATVALLQGGAVVLTRLIDPFWLGIDEDGTVVARGRFPLSSLDSVPGFARQPIAASNRRSDWAVVFPYGNLLLLYEGYRLQCSGRRIQGQGFPRMPDPDLPFSLAAVAILDTSVIVLADGGGDQRLRYLDTYSMRTCEYSGTVTLPRKFSALSVDDDLLVFEYEDPIPTIVGLRLVQ